MQAVLSISSLFQFCNVATIKIRESCQMTLSIHFGTFTIKITVSEDWPGDAGVLR